MAKKKVSQPDIDFDLTPMIDIIFLLIIFFILAGRITSEITNEMITVPPTRTAHERPDDRRFERVRVEVFGRTQEETRAGVRATGHTISVGTNRWRSSGHEDRDAFIAYIELRRFLDQVYDRAAKYPDPKGTGLQLPYVIIELRADGETEYRVVQEIQQVMSDTIMPEHEGQFMVSRPTQPPRPFVNIEFTTRQDTD